ncbi:MAG: lipoprotein [Cellvibrio sp.]|uniref:LPS translocon maturation chaperone LptM n=1 Tax=Cellvibrio sp. TaxID=1965322 RepID=UPI0031A41622
MKTAVVLMLLCLGLGACGQKGPLYLPQPVKPQPEKTEAPRSQQPEQTQEIAPAKSAE